MKSSSILVGVLASLGTAQPHGSHRHLHRHAPVEERGRVHTEMFTHWQTETWTKVIGQWGTETHPPAGWTAPADNSVPTATAAQEQAHSPSSSTPPIAPIIPQHTAASPSNSVYEEPELPSPTTTNAGAVFAVVTPTVQHTTLVSSTTAAAPVAPSVAPSVPSNGGSSGGYDFTGDFTFYTLGMGSCGIDSGIDQSAPVVALAVGDMTAGYSGNPNHNPNCGRQVEISYGGKTGRATVVDTCMGCANGALDTSLGFFLQFATEAEGRVKGMQWKYVS